MTEEEKRAIETLQYLCSDDCINKDIIKTIVNLIEKLKKENKELKEKVFKRDKELIRLEEYANQNFERKDDVKAKYIPKEKIREYIKEKEEEKKGVKNISLEEYAITSKELKESEICLLKCLLEEE